MVAVIVGLDDVDYVLIEVDIGESQGLQFVFSQAAPVKHVEDDRIHGIVDDGSELSVFFQGEVFHFLFRMVLVGKFDINILMAFKMCRLR